MEQEVNFITALIVTTLTKMKTDKHDKIHLWFHDRKNVDLFILFMRDHVPEPVFTSIEYRKDPAFDQNDMRQYRDNLHEIETFEFLEKDIEMPIFQGKAATHTNTIDNVITVTVSGSGVSYRLGKKSYDNPEDKRQHSRDLAFELKILSEYKPELNRISNFLGQIKVYQMRLAAQKDHAHVIITPVLVTLDQERIYDNMIQDQGITIFRLEYDEYKERVVTPHSLLMQYAEQTQVDKPDSEQKLTE